MPRKEWAPTAGITCQQSWERVYQAPATGANDEVCFSPFARTKYDIDFI